MDAVAVFLVFWVLQVAIIVRGMETMRRFENWAAPFVIARRDRAADLDQRQGGRLRSAARPALRRSAGAVDFWKVFFPALTGMIGFWATLSLNIPDFTRYAPAQRDQVLGQALGLPTTMALSRSSACR